MNKLIRILTIATIVLCATLISDQQARSDDGYAGESYDLIVNPRENNPDVPEISLNHTDGVYVEGDKLTLTIKSPISGYLYVMHYNSKGKRSLIVPNKYWSNNEIRAGETVQYPSKDMPFELDVQGPIFGNETITVLVTTKRVATDRGQYAKGLATELDDEQFSLFFDEMKSVNKDLVVRPRNEINLPIGNVNSKPQSKPQPNPIVSPKSEAINVSFYTMPREGNVGVAKPNSAKPQTKRPERWALCIGVNKYRDPNIRDLRACANDALAFYQVCRNELRVPESNIVTLLNEGANKRDIVDLIKKSAAEIPSGSEVFLFWSGHGYKTASTLRRSNAYLVPNDGKTSDPQSSMISADELGALVKSLAGKKVLIYIDACYSGGLPESAKGADDSAPFIESIFDATKGINSNEVYVMASSTDSQPSFESIESDRKKSVFTNALVETISNSASPLSHKDVKAKVKSLVEEEVRRSFPGATQTVVDQDSISNPIILK